jgi:hypothetical protein
MYLGIPLPGDFRMSESHFYSSSLSDLRKGIKLIRVANPKGILVTEGTAKENRSPRHQACLSLSGLDRLDNTHRYDALSSGDTSFQ